MKTIHACGGQPVIAGELTMHRKGPERLRPVLAVSIFCPYCHDTHLASVPDVIRLDGVFPLSAPCRSGAFAGQTIGVMVDPSRAAEARRMIVHHSAALRRWKSEQRFKSLRSEELAMDRRYRKSWPDSRLVSTPGAP